MTNTGGSTYEAAIPAYAVTAAGVDETDDTRDLAS